MTPPVEIAAWLGCLAFVVLLLRNGIGLVRDLKDKPAPHEVQAESAAKFVHRAVHDAHVAQNQREHENLFSKIGGVERGGAGTLEKQITTLRTERTAHDGSVQTQLTTLTASVAALDVKTELQNEDLAGIHKDVEQLRKDIKSTPSETVALLRATKGLIS